MTAPSTLEFSVRCPPVDQKKEEYYGKVVGKLILQLKNLIKDLKLSFLFVDSHCDFFDFLVGTL